MSPHPIRRSPSLRALTAVLASSFLTAVSALPMVAQTTVGVTNAIPITFSGEVRARAEWDKPGGSLQADQFTYLRARFGIKVDATSNAHVVLQVQDSRVLGGEGNPLTSASTLFDLHQGYIELSAPWHNVQYAVRAGRQEMPLANERVVGASNWTNTGRSFDGVRLMFAPEQAKAGAEPWTLSAFAMTVEEHGRHFGTTGDEASTVKEPDHSLVGLYATRHAETSHAGVVNFEGTALYDAGSSYRSYHNANRGTLDGRLRVANVLGVHVELEGAVQFGRQRYAPDTLHATYQDVGAWLVGARVGTADKTDARTSVAVGVDMLSGDASPSDDKYSAFSTLFASNHQFYGLQDIIGDPATSTKERGLIDALATASQRLSSSVSLKAELHHFTMATGSNATLGWEADITVPVRLGSAANLDVGYSLFHPGAGAATVGLGASGASKHWLYLSLRAGF
ncbi:MAG: alginate export family protein [Gemmatimonadaceae bacterium]